MGVRWTANPFRFGDYGVNMVKTRSLETRKLGLDGGLRSHRVPFKFQKVHIKNSQFFISDRWFPCSSCPTCSWLSLHCLTEHRSNVTELSSTNKPNQQTHLSLSPNLSTDFHVNVERLNRQTAGLYNVNWNLVRRYRNWSVQDRKGVKAIL